MLNHNTSSISTYKKPKRKTFKIILTSLIAVILIIGIWVGLTAFSALKRITAFSNGNGNIFSFLGSNREKLKGEDEGRTNILLLGMGGKNHPGGTLTDTIMVMSIDWKTKKMALITIPRDLWVPIAGFGNAKINEAYTDGEKNAKTTGGGGKLASDTVSKVLGVPIHYFVTIDFDGFKKLVDTVGGIDVTVDKAIYDPFYPAANMIDYDPFRISAGEHHLDGATALKYARSRKTTSDFDRSKRQAQVIGGVKEKALTLNILANPKKLTELMNILGDHLRTSLSLSEIKSLWETVKDMDMDNTINKVFDTSAGGPLVSTEDERGYIIIPKKGANNFSEIQTIVKNIFNESEPTDIAVSDIEIEVLNGSGKAGQATLQAEQLKKDGYKVSKIANATKTYDDSIIYTCSQSSVIKQAANKIANSLDAEVKTKTDCGNIDIQVIVGKSIITR